MIGCSSHRFNLAVMDYLKDFEDVVEKVTLLTTKLRTIKGRALLRRVSDLSLILRNETRWSSTFLMVQRFVQLEQPINSLGHGILVDSGLASLMMRRSKSEILY